jgi:hypothetical protein
MFGSESADISLQFGKEVVLWQKPFGLYYGRRNEPSLQLQSVREFSMNLLFFGFVLL